MGVIVVRVSLDLYSNLCNFMDTKIKSETTVCSLGYTAAPPSLSPDRQ